MGRRYYCEYCDKSFVETLEAVKKHRNGLSHQKLMKEHYHKFRDKHLILAEETVKKPCNRYFNSGDCPFGSICRYSHYTKEQLDELRWEVSQSQQAATSSTSHEKPTLQNWFASRRKRLLEDSPTLEKAFLETVFTKESDVTSLMSWKYPEIFDRIPDLPPSLKRLKGTDFKDVNFAKWG